MRAFRTRFLAATKLLVADPGIRSGRPRRSTAGRVWTVTSANKKATARNSSLLLWRLSSIMIEVAGEAGVPREAVAEAVGRPSLAELDARHAPDARLLTTDSSAAARSSSPPALGLAVAHPRRPRRRHQRLGAPSHQLSDTARPTTAM